jgi:hypothetical protein
VTGLECFIEALYSCGYPAHLSLARVAIPDQRSRDGRQNAIQSIDNQALANVWFIPLK